MSFASALAVSSVCSPVIVYAADIQTVHVDDPNNVPLQHVTSELYSYWIGSVSYSYRIGQYEVTNAQYTEFLNARAQSDPFDLYNPAMESDPRGGIQRTGVDGSFYYEVKDNMGSKPVNYVSLYDAMRFTNWMSNGALDSSDTETGTYTIAGSVIPGGLSRNPGSTWVLPGRNEWYKAAYFDPRTPLEGGPSDGDNYWRFPTMSDIAPTVATANPIGDISNPGINVANHFFGADWNGQDGNVTTVGSAGLQSASYYGTYDQGGNVWEWTEHLEEGYPVIQGGAWRSFDAGAFYLSGDSFSGVGGGDGTLETSYVGFRLAMVPEPSSLWLALVGGLIVLSLKRR